MTDAPLIQIPPTTPDCEPFIKQGDTIPVIQFDLSPEFTDDLTMLHIVRMQLYNKSKKVLDLTSEANAGITITGATTFEINKISENDLPVGTLKGDIQIEKYSSFGFAPTDVNTYFNIEYTIVKQYTKIPDNS